MAVERAYGENVHQEFTDLVVQATKLNQEANSDLGAMTTPMQVEIVKEHVEDALPKEQDFYRKPPEVNTNTSLCLEPMVLVNVTHAMKIMKEETFDRCCRIMACEH